MNNLAVSNQQYLETILAALYPPLPELSSPWKCSHLPPALLKFKLLDNKIVKKLVDSCKTKLTEVIDKTNQLTALHFAAITNTIENLTLLCKEKSTALIKKQDRWGFTPLHFRALAISYDPLSSQSLEEIFNNDPFVTAFTQECADIHSVKNKWEQTPLELFQFANSRAIFEKTAVKANAILNFNDKSSCEETTGFAALAPPLLPKYTQVDKACLGDFYFTDSTVATPETLIKKWAYMMRDNRVSTPNNYVKEYQDYLKSQPLVSISQTSQAKGCGVFAKHKIAKGSIIREFSGEYAINNNGEDQLNNSNYYYGAEPFLEISNPALKQQYQQGIEPVQFRSVAAMINDGLPNAIFNNIYNTQNLPVRTVIVAIKDIQPDEEIFIDYGVSSEIKYTPHYQFDKKTLEAHWKKLMTEWSSKEIQDQIAQIKGDVLQFIFSQRLKFGNDPSSAQHIHLTESILYAMLTPPICFYLINEGLMDHSLIDAFNNEKSMSVVGFRSSVPFFADVTKLMNIFFIVKSMISLSTKNKNTVNRLYDILAKNFDYSALQIVQPESSKQSAISQSRISLNSFNVKTSTLLKVYLNGFAKMVDSLGKFNIQQSLDKLEEYVVITLAQEVPVELE